jgi:hypothetical protein
MTPLLIEILMHYATRGDDYRDGDFSAPAVREGIDWLRDDAKLIEHRQPNAAISNMYQLTERGRVYFDALQSVPLPVQVWVMPAAKAA